MATPWGESPVEGPVVSVHAPGGGAFGERGGPGPGPVGPDRAGPGVVAVDDLDVATSGFGVGLRPPELDEQPFRGRGDVGQVQPGELGPAHPAGVADEQEGPVPEVGHAVVVELVDWAK